MKVVATAQSQMVQTGFQVLLPLSLQSPKNGAKLRSCQTNLSFTTGPSHWESGSGPSSQANASLMAAAYAKLTGRLAVCVATSGPGASNLTTGRLDPAHKGGCSQFPFPPNGAQVYWMRSRTSAQW